MITASTKGIAASTNAESAFFGTGEPPSIETAPLEECVALTNVEVNPRKAAPRCLRLIKRDIWGILLRAIQRSQVFH